MLIKMSTCLSLVYQICFEFWTHMYTYQQVCKVANIYTGQTCSTYTIDSGTRIPRNVFSPLAWFKCSLTACLTYIVNMYFTQTGLTCVVDSPIWSSHSWKAMSKTTRVCLKPLAWTLNCFILCFLISTSVPSCILIVFGSIEPPSKSKVFNVFGITHRNG